MAFEDLFELTLKVWTKAAELQARGSQAAFENAAHGALAWRRGQQEVANMSARLAEQEQEITELRYTLVRLIDIARSSGAVDLEAYRRSVQEALDAYRSELRASEPPPSPEDLDRLTCANCSGSFPRRRTTITGAGVLCDACFTAASL